MLEFYPLGFVGWEWRSEGGSREGSRNSAKKRPGAWVRTACHGSQRDLSLPEVERHHPCSPGATSPESRLLRRETAPWSRSASWPREWVCVQRERRCEDPICLPRNGMNREMAVAADT